MAEKTNTEGVELVIRLHPVTGEDVSITCFDFPNENDALDVITRAVNMRQSLVLNRAKYGREASEAGVVVNLANVVSVRVSSANGEGKRKATGQYI